jgi:hypothetical protein
MQSRLWPADSELCPVYIGARAQQRAKGFARAVLLRFGEADNLPPRAL